MKMDNKITIINFSSALVQEDAVEGENIGIKYYDTQKGALINYLTLAFHDIPIDMMGLNTNFLFEVEDYGS